MTPKHIRFCQLSHIEVGDGYSKLDPKSCEKFNFINNRQIECCYWGFSGMLWPQFWASSALIWGVVTFYPNS